MQFSLNMVQRQITTWGKTGDIFGKFLKVQRSKVNELCQNWLEIAPNFKFFTINPNPMVQFQPNIVKRWITTWGQTGDIVGEIAGRSEVKGQ